VLDADIEAAFDNVSHPAVMERVRARVKDKRVLALVRAFLKAGVLTSSGSTAKLSPARRRDHYVQLNISRPMRSAGLCAVPAFRGW
jgi:hypothetical protein